MSRNDFTMKFDDAEVKRILDKLGALASDVQKKHAKSAAKKAMRPVMLSAKQKWQTVDDPSTTLSISESIAMKLMGAKKLRMIGGDVGVSVGVKGGAQSKKKDKSKEKKQDRTSPFYWRFLEFGTSHIQARGFMRQAAKENVRTVQQIFMDELGKDVHQQARKRTAR